MGEKDKEDKGKDPKIIVRRIGDGENKLYAVASKRGRFKDIQTYKRAHSADLRKKVKAGRYIVVRFESSGRYIVRIDKRGTVHIVKSTSRYGTSKKDK